MSSISNKVLALMNETQYRGAGRVRAIYLGTEESAEMDAEFLKRCTIPMRAGETRPKRRTFNGAEIFRVDAASHLGVSA